MQHEITKAIPLLDSKGNLTQAGYAFIKSAGLMWPLFYTGVFYLVFVGILTIFFNWLERKLDYFR